MEDQRQLNGSGWRVHTRNCEPTFQKDVAVRLRDLWRCLESKQDLLDIINIAFEGIYGDMSQTVSMKQLANMAYTGNGEHRYHSFQIPKKKKGEFRTIDAPVPLLKNIQRALNCVLQAVYTPHTAAMGFVKGCSVVDNARVHLGQRYVYNIDLKDFFPSISSGRVYACLCSKRFSLLPEIASLICDLCCYTNSEGRKVLPQGAPTSPTITNIVCERMDRQLQKLAHAYGLRYTRYADDITFSGNTYVFAPEGRFCKRLKHIVEEEERFTINPNKTRLEHQGMRQEATGVTVNHKPNVSRDYVRQLRTLIHNWEMNGYQKAQAEFLVHYAATNTKNLQWKGTHHIENIIAGKLLYMKMVKGETDSTYRGLKKRFDLLMNSRLEYIDNIKKSNKTTGYETESDNGAHPQQRV